jgi:hypothetical protein
MARRAAPLLVTDLIPVLHRPGMVALELPTRMLAGASVLISADLTVGLAIVETYLPERDRTTR